MDVIIGDLWEAWRAMREVDDRGALWTPWIVVPTNVGWKRSGAAVMGKGVAYRASSLSPYLARKYGEHCEVLHEADQDPERPFFYRDKKGHRFICTPTKSLDLENPQLSWQKEGEERLVSKSIDALAAVEGELDRVLLPVIGSGESRIHPILTISYAARVLKSDKFTMVIRAGTALMVGIITPNEYRTKYADIVAREEVEVQERKAHAKALKLKKSPMPEIRVDRFIATDELPE